MRPCPCQPPTSICAPTTCWGDPHSALCELREAGPAVRLTAYDAWVLPRYEHVHAALAVHERFSSAHGVGYEDRFNAQMKGTVPTAIRRTTPGCGRCCPTGSPSGPWRSSVPGSPAGPAGEPVRKLNNVI